MSATPSPDQPVDPHHDRRWLVLAVLGIAQLMVILDATIVTIALPSAEKDLGFSPDNRQWVITAYALAFGSLLLLGGRLSDLLGRKRVFLVGLAGFAVASAVGGTAQSFGVLVGARALQGLFGALLAPAALSLVTTTFTDVKERNTAFGIFGALAGVGAGVGLLLGGVLTEYLTWRWCLYVNLAFAIPAAVAAIPLLHQDAREGRGGITIDVPGTVTVTAGLFALVYGFSNAEMNGWTAPLTIVMLVASVALIAAFVVVERRVAQPLLPLRVVLDRNRGGSFLALGIVSIGIFGVSLFLTFYLQGTLRFSPVEAGLAFLPMNGAIMVSIGVVASQLLPRVGPRVVIAGGLAVSTVGLVLLAQLDPGSSYAGGVLPGLVVFGAGFGAAVSAGLETATRGLEARDAGVGSAMVNTAQQVGGSIGTALLSTIFASAMTNYAASDAPPGVPPPLAAAVHGYTVAFWVGAAIIGVTAVVCAALIRPGKQATDSSTAVVPAI